MDLTKCSVRSCQNPKNGDYKMCKRCQDTQARQSVKKRERKRAEREANGETLRKRVPNRPKPPLFWIRSQGATGLYTRRDWEHLDKSIFNSTGATNSDGRSGPTDNLKDVIELIPIKICCSKSCHQPLPAAYPLKACSFCRRPNLKSNAVAGAKRKRCETDELPNKVADIAHSLSSDVLETKAAVLTELTELIRNNRPLFSEDPKLWRKLISSPSPLIEALSCTNTSVQIQALILMEMAPIKLLTAFQSELSSALSRVIELLQSHPTREYASDVIQTFCLEEFYRNNIAISIPILIELLKDNSFDWESAIITLSVLALSPNSYSREIAPVVPRLKEILGEPSFSTDVWYLEAVINLLRNLSYLPEAHCDIASIIPRVIELMEDIPLNTKWPLRLLCRFCDDREESRIP